MPPALRPSSFLPRTTTSGTPLALRSSRRGIPGGHPETGIAQPVAHSSYLINLASPDDLLWKKSIEALAVEVERCEVLGIPDLVIHPGAHMGQGEKKAVIRIARRSTR